MLKLTVVVTVGKIIKNFRRKFVRARRYVERQFVTRRFSQPLISIGCIALVLVYLLSSAQPILATGSWNQTDWSGGTGSSTTNQYSAQSNVDTTSTAGSISLSKTEKLTNGNLNSNSTGWDTNYLYATPTLIQSKSVGSTSVAVTTITTTFDTTPVVGNTIIVALAVQGTGVVTPPSGYTTEFDYRNDSTNTRIVYLRKVAGASEPTAISATTSVAKFMNMDSYEFSNVASSSPFDSSVPTYQSANASSVAVGPTSTTVQANELALAMASWSSGVNTPTWSNSFVKAPVPTGSGSSVFATSAYKAITPAQAVSATATTTGSRPGTGAVATYKTNSAMTTTTHESTIVHGGGGSTKLVAVSTDDAAFTQAVNAGDTNNYNLEAYVYTNGGAVSSTDAGLMADGTNITTTYTSVGSGWYKLSGVIAGTASSVNYGVKVKAGKTVYVDDLSLNRYVTSGTLTSNIYNTAKPSNWGTLNYVSTGTVQVKARSSNSPTMSGAPGFSSCSAVTLGADISSGTGGCVTDTERYIQYEVTLTTAATQTSATLSDITISFADSDSMAPTVNASDLHMYASNGGAGIADSAWTNAATPYFTWTAGQDNSGGLGVKGYCLYLGQDETANPTTTKGLLGTSPLDTEGTCPFAISGTSLNLATLNYLGSAMTSSNTPYHLEVRAIDFSHNVMTSNVGFAFKFDNTAPINPAYITAPSSFINTKSATLSWATSGADAASDANSGLSGLQYKIGTSGTWYGDSHSGAGDATDLLANDGSYSTQSTPDFANLTDGNNVIYFRTWDAAGNVTQANVTTVLKINTAGSPSSPRNITATPSTNTQNSFAFSWLAPASFVGQASNLTYCYTVNTQPTEQTCTFTSAGTTNVPAGAFATQPGTNTFYVVAKDESGGINYATAGSVDFTANTSAPGMPLNLDISDTSIKSSNNWRLVISWDQPSDVGAGVSKYQIYRSTDNNSFTLAGSTSGTSYVDTGLSSQLYYYKIKACDSANNCGAFSETGSKTPTGRFTTAPELSTQPKVESLSTRKAKIVWNTDRKADSKIAVGASSGHYFSTESYNSGQVTEHGIELSNLDPGTTYYYVARWTDEDGNTGQSSELTFETLPRPVVEDVSVPAVGLTNAVIQYTTTGANKIKLYYGKTGGFGGLVELNTSTSKSVYNSSLPDLEDGTKYFYKINTLDTDGNEYEGTTLSFVTPPAPKITNLTFQPIENEPSSSQKVSWETNVPASSELAYGVTGLSESSVTPALVVKHEVVIRGLKDDSQYRLVARSRDGSGNMAVSDEQIFKTALDTRPPVVSDIVTDSAIRGTGAEARGQVVISWRTDEPSSSQVAYGEGTSGFLSNTTNEDARMTYEHIVVISDLSPSRVYHFEPRSFDAGRNQGSGEQQVAIIGRASDSVLSIIFNALQQLFGVN